MNKNEYEVKGFLIIKIPVNGNWICEKNYTARKLANFIKKTIQQDIGDCEILRNNIEIKKK